MRLEISFISDVASPASVMLAEAAGTSIPEAVPIFSLLGTNM